jgi:hypothetical protein
MTRIVLGLAILLYVATSGHAGCAWVLWDDIGPLGHTIEYRKTAAYESRAACFKAAEVRAHRLLGTSLQVYVAPDETWMADSADGRTGYRAQCWPNTAEPNRVGERSHLK